MNLTYPSREFDQVVADACHGIISDKHALALNQLLLDDPAALDEYIMRLELHSRLASAPALFPSDQPGSIGTGLAPAPIQLPPSAGSPSIGNYFESPMLRWLSGVVVCLLLIAGGIYVTRAWQPEQPEGTTSTAVAMLNGVVDAKWDQRQDVPRLGAALEPGLLRLESGLAQVVFYSGARVVIEGPAELQIISPSEAACTLGRLTAVVPVQAQGFRIGTPQITVSEPGTEFGLDVKDETTEIHVFAGSVSLKSQGGSASQRLSEGEGMVVDLARPSRHIACNSSNFVSLLELQPKSMAAAARRYDQWRSSSEGLNHDSSLLVHFEFEPTSPLGWQLPNTSICGRDVPSATVIGGQWGEGRWPGKAAFEFNSVNDRIRLNVPGEMSALTAAAWVRVRGLDRKINSLFMCEGFAPGTIHWLIRNDGVLGLTVVGQEPGEFQIIASPPVVKLDQFGMWLHLAVVLDGDARRVSHYINGVQVSQKALRLGPPFRIGAAELGNWNANGFSGHDSMLIRNFSGAMDEFCLFSRALRENEIRALYAKGKPQPDVVP